MIFHPMFQAVPVIRTGYFLGPEPIPSLVVNPTEEKTSQLLFNGYKGRIDVARDGGCMTRSLTVFLIVNDDA